jgi:outer membrane protein assembly factor BamD
MRDLVRICYLLAIVPLLWSCGQKSVGLQEGAAAPDTQLFENGMTYLDKGQHIKARLSFQTLINTYPDSEFTPASFLGIADSYYQEGGTQNFLQAEAQYKDFLIFYPTHEMADDAQLKVAAINYKMMKPYDRDPTYTRKAEAEFKRFLENYPDSELAPTAREALLTVEEALAKRDHEIAEFYYKRKAWNAAEMRYKEVLDKYPDFSGMDATLFKLGRSLEQSGRVAEAVVYFDRVAVGYPFSRYFEEARNRLVLLEMDVPEVDEQAAARHAANRKEESFSVLDPMRSVFQVFTGRPDIYEIARQRAEGGDNEGEEETSLGPVPESDK